MEERETIKVTKEQRYNITVETMDGMANSFIDAIYWFTDEGYVDILYNHDGKHSQAYFPSRNIRCITVTEVRNYE